VAVGGAADRDGLPPTQPSAAPVAASTARKKYPRRGGDGGRVRSWSDGPFSAAAAAARRSA